MPMKITKKNNTSLVKTPHQKMRSFMAKHGSQYNPKTLTDRLAKQLDSGIAKNPTQQFLNEYEKVGFALGLETHTPVSESVKEEYRYFLTDMIQSIEREYSCKTAIEKSLAEAIGLTHVRIISLSKTFNDYISGDRTLSKERNEYYDLIGKELDRAYRQLNSSILTLRQIKISTTPLKVNAKTAYFAQNQQINNYDNQDEINERQ